VLLVPFAGEVGAHATGFGGSDEMGCVREPPARAAIATFSTAAAAT
jgi:hypothetical protein